MTSSLSKNTLAQYNVAYAKWWDFCNIHNTDFLNPSVNTFVSFLTRQFERGSSYSTLNTYRSALNIIFLQKLDDQLINRFLRGVFKLRPVFPKYTCTWDPAPVLQYLATLYPLHTLSLECLTHKLSLLLALCTAHRLQTFAKIKINNLYNLETKIEVLFPDLLKTSGPGREQPKLHLPFFKEKPELCVASTLLFYIAKTKPLRGNILELFITYKKPFHAATTQTISRWIKKTLGNGGIDIKKFTAYSTRHAASSAAFRAGVSIDTIRATAGWSKNSDVFFKFYNQPLPHNSDFSRTVILDS